MENRIFDRQPEGFKLLVLNGILDATLDILDIARNYELPLVYFIATGGSWESRVK